MNPTSQRGFPALVKGAVDRCAALAGLVLAAPVMAVVAIAILLEGKGPVLFSQVRPGLHGRPFRIYKFRTLRPGPEPDGERQTALGNWLRRTSLDELPQLWNVLRGELSLVGPRPLLMEYLPRYSKEQARRHDVKPGITGYAQVRGRNDIAWADKFACDLYYVEHWSLGLDLRILLLTLRMVWTGRGVAAPGALGDDDPFAGTASNDPPPGHEAVQ